MYSEALSLVILIQTLQDLEFRLAPNHPTPKFIFSVNIIPDCGVSLAFQKRMKPV
jgi:hypothetical protein